MSRPGVRLAVDKLPTPANVERASRVFHPNGPCGLWPEPRGGIFTRLIATARLAASLSRSPGFDLHYGIEPKDYSTKGLLFGASLEPEEPLSWRIRLYGPLT